MYRPKFCAECGEAVVRSRWRVWTSRRFCPSCDVRFVRGRLIATLAAVALSVGFGFVLGRQGRHVSSPVIVDRRGGVAPAASLSSRPTGVDGARGSVATERPAYGPDGTAGERPTEPDEVVSICGARTKKGAPCQRRVRGTGRCWQHRGKGAMLPPSKLLVPN